MQRFTLDQLATLLALMSAGSFEAAARQLHITSSAVSQRVKTLELLAGRVLVQRTTPVRLTEAGEVLLRYARQIDLLEADALRALGTHDTASARITLSLAVNADSLATWFLDAIADVADTPETADTPNIAFDLHREDQVNTTSLLRSGAVMAAVTSTREPVQGCTVETLGVMRYRAVASSGFAARWLGEARPLCAAPMVAFDRDDDLQEVFLDRHAGGTPTGPPHYIPTSNDFARAILRGFGWGLLPEQQCLTGLAAGKLVEIAPQHPLDVPLYWQRWNLASPLLDIVSAAVRAGAHRALLPL